MVESYSEFRWLISRVVMFSDLASVNLDYSLVPDYIHIVPLSKTHCVCSHPNVYVHLKFTGCHSNVQAVVV